MSDHRVKVEELIERVAQLEDALDKMLAAFREDLAALREDLARLRPPLPQDFTPTKPPPPPGSEPRRVAGKTRTISEELAVAAIKRDPRSE